MKSNLLFSRTECQRRDRKCEDEQYLEYREAGLGAAAVAMGTAVSCRQGDNRYGCKP